METTYYIFSFSFILISILPFISDQHWVFRIVEFARIQKSFLLLLILVAGFVLVEEQKILFWICQALLGAFLLYNLFVLIPYTQLFRKKIPAGTPNQSGSISLISVNVYQFNQEYQRLIDLIGQVKPDIILTMESNKAWENALSVLDQDYPNYQKIALENTYGMHFYTRLKVHDLQVHYFVANDLPSIQAELESPKGKRFTLFGVHPPPPSPTEEETSKERDGELLSVAKLVREIEHPVVVVGDFNNVAWAKSSVLFRKTSELIDPRIGRGFVSTFHAKYKLLRFPIDLFFHSTDVFIEKFRTLSPIGSDHLPLYCRFYINYTSAEQEERVDELEQGEKEEVDEMIEEGKKEESDRPTVAEE